MAWPLSQDFNEAIQNPSTAFADADLKAGSVATTPLGVPLPRSGNYADVYQITGKDGRSWAVKCFTRAVAPDLQARYAAIAGHLAQANLPFTVGFEFLANGIRVKGKAYPAVKMQWVEGSALNTFVKDNLNRATILESMLSLWVRLCRRLRETGMAHCDLQHGNVLLVPGEKQNALGLKLVDYDGMFVPALAGKPPGEAGHASFQHPQRVQINAYSADLDRFPHLVVATALRGLLIGGKALWDKYDTGDNLLFTAKDFTAAHQSKVMRELWDTGDPFTVGLLSHLVMSCAKPLAQTPWLDTLMPEGRPPVLTPSQERQAMQLLGVPVQGVVPTAPPPPPGANWNAPTPPPPPAVSTELGFEGASGSRRHAALRQKNNSKVLYGAIAAGVIAFVGIAAGIVAFSGGGKNSGSGGTVQNASTGSAAPVTTSAIVTKTNDPPPEDPSTVESKPLENVPPGKLAWTVPAGATAEVVGHTVAYTPDGTKILISQADTGRIQVLDAASGKVTATFQDHEPTAQVVMAPLPDGKVLSAGKEPVLLVWSAETGKAAARVAVKPPSGPLHALFTDASGNYALLAAGTKAVVYDLDAGSERLTLDLPSPGLRGRCGAMLAADGTKVLALTADGKLTTHSLDGSPGASVAHGIDQAAQIAAWLPEKNLAAIRARTAAGGLAPVLHIVKTDTGEKVKAIPDTVGPAAFTLEGDYLVVAAKGQVNYLAVADWTPKASVPVSGSLYDLAVSPDGTRAAFATSTHNVAALAAPWGGSAVSVKPPAASVEFLAPALTLTATDLDNKPVVAAAVDKEAKKLFLSDGEKIRALDIATKAEAFNFMPPGKVRNLWATDAGFIAECVHPNDAVKLHLFSDSGSLTSDVNITSLQTIKSVAVNAGGTHAAVALGNGNVTVYSIKDKKPAYTMQIWNKETPPADPVVSPFWPDNADRLFLWRSTRLQVYPIDDLNKYTFYPPGGGATGIDDISHDGRLAAFRAVRKNDVLFNLKNPGPEWKSKAVAIRAANAVASFRFLGNGGRAVVFTPGKVEVFDTMTAKSIGAVDVKPPESATRAAVNSARTAVVVYGGAYVAVLTSAAKSAVAVKPPDTPETPTPAKARKPVPTDDAIRTADKEIRDIFKEYYAKKLPADRKRLAEHLLKTAADTAAPASKYAMLREVQSLAVELSDTQLGAKAIDAEDAEFEVDGMALRVGLLERIGGSANKTDVLKGLAETCGEMVEDLAEKSEFDKAIKLTSVGLAALARANLQNLGRSLEQRQAQLRKLKDAYEPVKAALETLKKKADDAAANETVGRYRCFHLGRWAEGLPNLAHAADASLKQAATLDADTAAAPNKKADAWWAWGQSQSDVEKTAATVRAKYWYAKVLAAGGNGLERSTAENRLAFSVGDTTYRPGLVLELLPPANPKKKIVKLTPTPELLASEHKLVAGGANSFGVKMNGYLLAPNPGRYKISLEGRGVVLVKLFSGADQKTIFNVRDLKAAAQPREYIDVLPARPVAFYLEAILYTAGADAKEPNSIVFKWQRPGAKESEPIPLEAWYHNKVSEASLTEK